MVVGAGARLPYRTGRRPEVNSGFITSPTERELQQLRDIWGDRLSAKAVRQLAVYRRANRLHANSGLVFFVASVAAAIAHLLWIGAIFVAVYLVFALCCLSVRKAAQIQVVETVRADLGLASPLTILDLRSPARLDQARRSLDT